MSSNVKKSGIIATGETPKFKKKGNEEQFKLNAKVMVKLDEASKLSASRILQLTSHN